MNESLYGYHLPPNISSQGHLVDRLFFTVHGFMLLLFVGWLTFFLYTLVKFRRRPGHKAVYAPKVARFSTYLEVGVALFEAILLVVFAIPAWSALKDLIPPGPDRFEVRVIAQQFAWNIQYPGTDRLFGRTDPKLVSPDNLIGLDGADPAAGDDVVTINELHVPVNKKVVVHLSSLDVIHSFGVPVLRVKQDAIPGQSSPVWFQATRTGRYDIVCAQLCGLGHYRMKGILAVQTEEELGSWLREQREAQEASL